MPCGKIVNGKHYSIITDHLGTPIEAYNQEGELIWEREQDLYDNSRQGFAKENFRCPYYDPEIELCYNRFRYYHPETGRYISQDPIGFLSGEPNFFAYVSDTNAWVDVLGLDFFKDLNHTGDGHHMFPRALGDKLGIRDIIEGVKWYPTETKNTASLHKALHDKLKEAGIPFHPKRDNYTGSIDDALNAMDIAYKDFDRDGFLMIDGKKHPDLFPAEAMKKVREHIENELRKRNKYNK